jgi:hypothetical protein
VLQSPRSAARTRCTCDVRCVVARSEGEGGGAAGEAPRLMVPRCGRMFLAGPDYHAAEQQMGAQLDRLAGSEEVCWLGGV